MKATVLAGSKPVAKVREVDKNLVLTIAIKAADYLQLIKFKLSALVTTTVVLGYLIALKDSFLTVSWHFALTLAGVFLVVGAANAFNQILERDLDALMERTKNRPLPSGRMGVAEATVGAVLMAIFGLSVLFIASEWKTTVLAAVALAIYVLAYTPLKRKSEICTSVGAISGAIPPAIGWVAVRNEFSQEAFALFALQFLWQFPHFWAIAWMYRDDYRKAGFRIFPVSGEPNEVSRRTLLYTIATVAVSAYPLLVGKVTPVYAFGLAALGIWFGSVALQFHRLRTKENAKRLLCVADIYLPLVLLLWLLTRQS